MGIFRELRGYFNKEQEGTNKRQYDRRPCSQTGAFIDHDGNANECTILNMSLGGLCISTPGRVKPKEVIGFVNPSFEAKVIWTRRNVAGRNLAGLSFVQAVQ